MNGWISNLNGVIILPFLRFLRDLVISIQFKPEDAIKSEMGVGV